MKNMKKLTALVLALTMVFSMLMVAHAAEERMPSDLCGSCGDGELSEQVLSRSVKTEYDRCTHGRNDYLDQYRVHLATYKVTCNNCSYQGTYTAEEYRELIACGANIYP